MTKVEISTCEYEASHGKRPRGRGRWAFTFGARKLSEVWWASGNLSYGEAVKAAKVEAARRGVADDVVYVQP